MDALIGRVLGGRYRVDRRLGEGGMGTVYEGEQTDLRRKIAIKVLKPEAAGVQGLQRFQREARAAAALRNPHIVQVSDFQVNAGEPPFLVMELLEGYPLSDLITRDGHIEPQRLVVYARQVLAALFAAHDAGIIHRDIKPENVFVTQSAVGELVKLVDFGIAKLYGQAAEAVTRFGAVIGSVYYMSPEQAAGAETDPRSDLFSLGACMYHALSGKLPFEGSSAVAVLRALSLGERKPLRMVAPHVDARLEAIVHKALSGDPAARFQSAREMDGALALLLSQAPMVPGATASMQPGAEVAYMPTAEATAVDPHSGRPVQPMTQPQSMTGQSMSPQGVPATIPVVAGNELAQKRSPAVWIALAVMGLAATGVGGVMVGSRLMTPPGATATTLPPSAPPSSSLPIATSSARMSAEALVSIQPTQSRVPAIPASTGGSSKAIQDAGLGSVDRDAGRVDRDAGRVDRDAGSVKALTCSTNDDCQKTMGQFARCSQGVCGCDEGTNLCGNRCVGKSDVGNCGGCGIKCAPDETCAFARSSKKHVCSSCDSLARLNNETAFAEYKYCGLPHWCENLRISLRSCGSCGNQCNSGTICRQGKCQ
jgi:serine/threonine protein kinase